MGYAEPEFTSNLYSIEPMIDSLLHGKQAHSSKQSHSFLLQLISRNIFSITLLEAFPIDWLLSKWYAAKNEFEKTSLQKKKIIIIK
jgi:hypothetical protein